MGKNESLTGRCICGQVKYRITEKPLFTQACHCKDCKIITGSSYVINTSVLDNTLIIEGDISSTELKQVVELPQELIFVTNVVLIFILIMLRQLVDQQLELKL